MTTETIEYIRCLECGWVGELDECEVSGADEGNVFCGSRPRRRCAFWTGVETEDRDSPRTNSRYCTAEIPIVENLFIPTTIAPTPHD